MGASSRPDGEGRGAAARVEAARLDSRVVAERVPAETALAGIRPLPARDASLARALLYGALRWHHRLEWQAGQLLNGPLAPGEATLAALLRVGLFQLQATRIPPHAAVAATVEACRGLGLARARGLVNAVLRRFLREREALLARGAHEPEARFSHPRWIIDAIEADWPGRSAAILDANNVQAPMWLRVNALRASPDGYLELLKSHGIDASLDARVASGVLLDAPRPTSALPGHADGLVSVQDGATQLAAGFLELAPGMRVLDACAAPGNKTAHMLESCPGLASVEALDDDAGRLASARENLARLGLAATLVQADALHPEAWWDGRAYDRILVDAPCTALGVIRRHPEIKILRTPAALERATELQARLLAALWPLLARGGRLLYATCSVLERENGAQVAGFLARTPDAALVGPAPGGRALAILPGEANMDGFHYACLQKNE